MKVGKKISKVILEGGDEDLRYNVPKKGGTPKSIATKQRLIWNRNKKELSGNPEAWDKKKKEMKEKFKTGLLSQ